MSERTIPYPPVFHDWRPGIQGKVATGQKVGGIEVQVRFESDAPHTWRSVELTEVDACLLAASLLQRAGHNKLSQRVLRKLS